MKHILLVFLILVAFSDGEIKVFDADTIRWRSKYIEVHKDNKEVATIYTEHVKYVMSDYKTKEMIQDDTYLGNPYEADERNNQ